MDNMSGELAAMAQKKSVKWMVACQDPHFEVKNEPENCS